MKILLALGRIITQKREAQETSLHALAKKAGMSKSVLWKIEHGRSDPQLTTLVKIADALNTHVDMLVAQARK